MADDGELFTLKELLAESRSIRDNVAHIASEMVHKDDFVRANEKMERRLDTIEAHVEEQKLVTADNSKFITGARWGLRVLAVAFLGGIVTALTSFVHIDFRGANAGATPMIITSPAAQKYHPPSNPSDYNIKH